MVYFIESRRCLVRRKVNQPLGLAPNARNASVIN